MGLHRLDGAGLDVKQCLPPPRDWTEREERRRTFWFAFCEDRYASIGTGWPMTIDEKDILTDLPASDEAFEMSKPERTQSLSDAMSPSGASKLSAFAGVVLMACLFGRNLIHLHHFIIYALTSEIAEWTIQSKYRLHQHEHPYFNYLSTPSCHIQGRQESPSGINQRRK
jgi:transcription factor-like protein